jgi:hypothetical protein
MKRPEISATGNQGKEPIMSKDKHADGQRDYAEGKGYNPPQSLLREVLAPSKQGIEDNKAYDAGWQNAKKQDK